MTAATGTVSQLVDPPAVDESLLIRRAREGDARAFEGLYRRLVSRVYGLCLRLTADPSVAEEMTQETFVRVWQKLHLFRGDRPFAPWLLTVATNVVLSDRRKRRRTVDREDPIEDAPPPAVRPTSVAAGAGVDLERAIRTLPDGARTVFVLHDVEGFRHEDIAGALGVSVGTTKSQLHRARRMLREVLDA